MNAPPDTPTDFAKRHKVSRSTETSLQSGLLVMAPSAHSVVGYAKRNGISRSSVYNLINDGIVVARKIGGRTVIYDEDNPAFRQSLPVVQPKAAGARAAERPE